MTEYGQIPKDYTPNQFTKGIILRDRPLKKGEKHHHHCQNCGQDIHPDFTGSHICNPLIKGLNNFQPNRDNYV